MKSKVIFSAFFALLIAIPLLFYTSCKSENDMAPISSKQEPTLMQGIDDVDLTMKRNAEAAFKAEYTTTPEIADGYAPGYNFALSIPGEGKGTHLGKSICDLYVWDCNDGCEGNNQIANMTLTAANGDQLYAIIIGNSIPVPCEEEGHFCVTFEGEYEFGWQYTGYENGVWNKEEVEGTGRFFGARGDGDYEGSASLPFPLGSAPGSGYFTLEGDLENP